MLEKGLERSTVHKHAPPHKKGQEHLDAANMLHVISVQYDFYHV